MFAFFLVSELLAVTPTRSFNAFLDALYILKKREIMADIIQNFNLLLLPIENSTSGHFVGIS